MTFNHVGLYLMCWAKLFLQQTLQVEDLLEQYHSHLFYDAVDLVEKDLVGGGKGQKRVSERVVALREVRTLADGV